MRPIRSDDADFPDSTVHLLEKVFSTPLSPSAKRGSLSHSQALALTIRARGVAGDAIALPEFWSASGAGARKGLAGVLTQQSSECLSASALKGSHTKDSVHSSPLIFRRIFYLDKAEIMPNNGNLLG